MKYQNEFLKELLHKAEVKRENAGYAGSMGDGGASRIEDEVAVYKAGLAGDVPETWAQEYKEFSNKQDPRYGEYIKLKGIFEP